MRSEASTNHKWAVEGILNGTRIKEIILRSFAIKITSSSWTHSINYSDSLSEQIAQYFKMLNFSIDFITGQSERVDPKPNSPDMNYGSVSSRGSASSVNSDSGSFRPDGSDSIIKALLTLDKNISDNFGAMVQPSPSTSPLSTSSSSSSSTKPSHSYIALISKAILSHPDKKMVLGDIYQYIMDNFPFYNDQNKAWKNSVRHNLSLNECFVKNGRVENGKSNFWSIHPACEDDFFKGDFRRRHARRRARKSIVRDMSSTNMAASGYYNMTPTTIAASLGVPTYSSPLMYPNTFYPGFYPTSAQAMYTPAPTSQALYAPANISTHSKGPNWICDFFKGLDMPAMNQAYPFVC